MSGSPHSFAQLKERGAGGVVYCRRCGTTLELRPGHGPVAACAYPPDPSRLNLAIRQIVQDYDSGLCKPTNVAELALAAIEVGYE